MEQHGAAYLSDTVVSFLKEKCISLEDCRGQTCALFVTCLVHNLNLVVGQAAGCVMEATDYFQFLQKLYTFFASSTDCWNVLKESLDPGIAVKRFSDTRWSARADTVSALQKKNANALLTEMWSNILFRCNETSNLQSDSLSLDVALKLVDSPTAFVKDQGYNFEIYEASSKQIHPDFEYKTNTTRSKQRSFRLNFFDGATEDI
ncbi:hypothetical protein RI129_012121 [Pyrocoelia pectoralis]|uniref:Uncharacterized protein n=1 Tax=Pyrocoelia pectoralis TaxID=417401 RepID=A0AAN7V986_9COLE